MFDLDERPKPKDWKGEPFLHAEQKLDGYRCTLIRTASGFRAYGRKKYIDLGPDLLRQTNLKDIIYQMPQDTVYDGELLAIGGRATDVPSRLIAGTGLIFQPFAIPFYRGKDNRFITALDGYDLILDKLKVGPVSVAGRNPLALKIIINDNKWEGLVLKVLHYSGWYKLKPVQTVDAVITGWKPGKSKNRGKIGSLEISVYKDEKLTPIGLVGAFPDGMREQNPDSFIGRVCEVHYDSVMSQGRLRFARFIRWRDDKPPEECLL